MKKRNTTFQLLCVIIEVWRNQHNVVYDRQNVVYEFSCDLCDASYIGYMCRHFHQPVEEHKHSVIGKHHII